jgi:endonuclease YncB( thermonuclease family)
MTAPLPFVYRFRPLRVVDGDTIVGRIDLGMRLAMEQEHVRLFGVDAPEIRGRDADPVAGPEAKAFVEAWIAAGTSFVLDSREFRPYDNFGRVLADLYRDADPVSLNKALVAAGRAVEALK